VQAFKLGRLPLAPEDGLRRGPGLQLVLDGPSVRAFARATAAEGMRAERQVGAAGGR